MAIPPHRFWRITLAEWRAVLQGYADRFKTDRRRDAWTVSHLLIAAGCEADKVTPAKLLGEKERPRKSRPAPAKMSIEEIWQWMKPKEE